MADIYGNKKGIKDSVLTELLSLYEVKIAPTELISQDLALRLADISEYINREISLYITRSGQIMSISIGSNESVELLPVDGRRGSNRLSGIRCVHTHPSGSSKLSGVDYSALKNNKFDAMITIGISSPDISNSLM